MELPDLGRHCADSSCKQLDYLPFKCQYCKREYCNEHSNPKVHNCPNAPSDDGERVPVCPVCNVPVPVSRGEDPNIRMNLHISNDCRPPSKTTSSKPFNACFFGKCKTRSPLPLVCSGCGKNYCIKHRLELDHNCDKVKKDNKVSNFSKLEALASRPSTANASKLVSTSKPKPVASAKPITTSKNSIKNWMGKLFK
ncbi:753_t:CDS:2 [Funneliformis mosseae]|uniref:753_t:CDS:1 n=1 Tax=Funneliformis mosseae TaxID=27381 RepID=A0A9N9A0A2_FUNMO|nr:753_t:CDS:2 [Funneliformis mosseae]